MVYQDRERKEMEKQQLISELSFLKSQVNPHFLFNSLNGIYALAIKKSDKTPDAVLQLSELMRHMLYESDREVVELEKEVEYLKNYIQLQNSGCQGRHGLALRQRVISAEK